MQFQCRNGRNGRKSIKQKAEWRFPAFSGAEKLRQLRHSGAFRAHFGAVRSKDHRLLVWSERDIFQLHQTHAEPKPLTEVICFPV
jgi:hypothetical protein